MQRIKTITLDDYALESEVLKVDVSKAREIILGIYLKNNLKVWRIE